MFLGGSRLLYVVNIALRRLANLKKVSLCLRGNGETDFWEAGLSGGSWTVCC